MNYTCASWAARCNNRMLYGYRYAYSYEGGKLELDRRSERTVCDFMVGSLWIAGYLCYSKEACSEICSAGSILFCAVSVYLPRYPTEIRGF